MLHLDSETYIYLTIIAVGLLIMIIGSKQRKKRKSEQLNFRKRYQNRKKEEKSDNLD